MKSIDRATAVFYKQEQIAKNFLKSGFEPELVARNTGVPLFMVNEIKERLAPVGFPISASSVHAAA